MDLDHHLFPEEFWTDSDIHISKLSDSAFEERRGYLRRQLDQYAKLTRCDRTTKEYFLTALEIRTSYSLLLPEPVPIGSLEYEDLLAIFSKMHSRAFGYTFRLCKDVHGLLNQNVTKFSIRIRHGDLICSEKKMWICRGRKSGKLRIQDNSSILPFSFDELHAFWPGDPPLGDVFGRMKWPFTECASIRSGNKLRMNVKPGEFYSEVEFSGLLPDLEHLQGFVNEMKPRKIEEKLCWKGRNPKFLEKILYLAEHITSSFSLDQSVVVQIVEKWQSGNWDYKAKTVGGYYNHSLSSFTQAVSGDRVLIYTSFNKTTTVLVPNQDNLYLVLIMAPVHFQHNRFREHIHIHANIRSLNDLANKQFDRLPRVSYLFPLDYSGYSGDPDSPLDAQAFCDLLTSYDRKHELENAFNSE